MKKALKCILFQIKNAAKINKWSIPLEIVTGVMEESRAMLAMFLPALVVSIIATPDSISVSLIVVTLVNIVIVLLSFGVEYCARRMCLNGIRFTNTMQLNLNGKTMRMNYADVMRSDFMELCDAASDGIWNSNDTTYYIFKVLLSRIIMIVITLCVFIRIHFLVAVVVLATIIAEYLLNVWNIKKQHKNDNESAVYHRKREYVDDTLFNQKVLRDMACTDAKSFLLQWRLKLTERIIHITRNNEALDFFENTLCSCFDIVRTISAYLIGLKQYVDRNLLISDFLLFISAAQQMTSAFFQMANAIKYIHRAVYCCEDYLQYMNQSESDRTEGKISVPTQTHLLEFRDVCFRYDNSSEDALHNVSFTISTNETIAIVGDNGAGKSTLVKLILRLFKVSSGDILLDGISIYKYKYSEYIKLFAPVFQDFNLYSFTLGENLHFGDHTKLPIMSSVLKKVDLLNKIESLPLGINTPYTKRFDENGVVFSGGEEQKLAIARAYSKIDATSMILDEPTASIDPLAEYDINKLILNSYVNGFLIFISHRLSTARFVTKIIVLEQGEVVEEGNHYALLNKANGVYKRMYDIQSSYYNNPTKRF